MANKRSTILKYAAASGATSQTLNLGAPSWAKTAVLKVVATTAAASTFDAKVQITSPDDVATHRIDTGVAIDQIAASATAVGRYVTFGELPGAALAGTSIDAVAGVPVSTHMKLVTTVVGTVTDVKVWVEFIGE